MKNYFEKRGKRFGWENKTDILGVSLHTSLLYNMKTGGVFFLMISIIYFLELFWEAKYWSTIKIILLIWSLADYLYKEKKISCSYASREKEEITQHYEKMCEQDKTYKERMTDMQYIDGWYMYFEKRWVCRTNSAGFM